MSLKNKTIKIISASLIISMMMPAVLFSLPKKANAFLGFGDIVFDLPDTLENTIGEVFGGLTSESTGVSAYKDLKDIATDILKEILKVAAKRVLAAMTQSTINWINSGFHGSPLFIENPDSFFKKIAKSEVKSLVDLIGYDSFRFPFGRQTALNVISSYKSQLATNAQYTLSKVINDPDLVTRYQNDFNYGGWNGFLVNTQYPQNNYLGFQMTIQENLAGRLEGTLQAPAQKVQNALQQGMGFLSPQVCPSNLNYHEDIDPYDPPTFDAANWEKFHPYTGRTAAESLAWSKAKDAAKAAFEFDDPSKCPGGLVNTTPGSIAANHVMTAINSPFLSTALDGALGNSLSAIFDALLNHFLDKGLNSISSSIKSTPAATDNWSYLGVSLGNDNGTSTSPDVPKAVSVTEGDSVSASIAGIGKAPYSIQTQPNSSIATASIRNDTVPPVLAVHGVSAGTTFVVVKDSSTPFKNARIQIDVNYIGALVVRPPGDITADTESPKTVNIYGGTPPYSIVTEGPNRPNQSVAIVSLAGSSLVVIGVKKGTTAVTIQDSSMSDDSFTPNPQTKTIHINIQAPGDLTIQDNVSTNINETTNVPISGGTPPYSIERVIDPNIATAEIVGTSLRITARSAGRTGILVKDSSSAITSITVDVTDPGNPTGICTVNGTINNDVTAADCATAHGVWNGGTGTTNGGGGNGGAPNSCFFPQTGVTSTNMTETNCHDNRGLWEGENPPLGTCTVNDTGVVYEDTTETYCNGVQGGGVWHQTTP